ncbi:ribonuclease HI [Buchnera aphidicola]|uniref:Ribonuclease H n=1 Tax=Buchnera aphidicola subsp. Melaphis rhois TaxID=118103 RepID=A0A4D6Y2X7_BUCMH|nr:ribonuclease HI [Buchnera aphidicola]QCI23259.1 ribonuclease HI [Buchnera aphidicola (Melaphis rhois)]
MLQRTVKIFSDGSCLGNPGPGGYSAIIKYKNSEITISEGFYLTTNNRMELMGVITALEKLKKQCTVEITVDSKYVKKGILLWIKRWKLNNWKTTKNKTVKNIDLWLRLNKISYIHHISWKWVKGHTGHPENEKCNNLAQYSAHNPTLKDVGYFC